jgi:deoxyribose-phosphate aldolase
MESIPKPDVLQGLIDALKKGSSPSGSAIAWLAPLIDHTFLKPEATAQQVRQLCAEGKNHGFASVCVNPDHVPLCAEELKGSKVKICVVVGFPLGAVSTRTKIFETKEAIAKGAQEIDMVLAVGRVKERSLREAYLDIRAVVRAAEGRVVKVILETFLLSQEEKWLAAGLAKAAGASFLKTSTGFSGGGATVEDVKLLRDVARETMGVKASGGIRSLEDALRMVAAGANRLGTSNGLAIISAEKPKASGGY